MAVQLHSAEPRTTLDIDLAVPTYADIPRQALLAAGFEHTGRHHHSDNWRAPGSGSLTQRVAVQFSAEDEGIADAVTHAAVVDLASGVQLRVARVVDLIVLKLAAAREPARRPSKRGHDVADVLALLEEHPELGSAEVLERVQHVRRTLMALDYRTEADMWALIDGVAPLAGARTWRSLDGCIVYPFLSRTPTGTSPRSPRNSASNACSQEACAASATAFGSARNWCGHPTARRSGRSPTSRKPETPPIAPSSSIIGSPRLTPRWRISR